MDRAIISSMVWRYQFIATDEGHVVMIPDSGKFEATDADDAKSFLQKVLHKIEPSEPLQPDAVRLMAPNGEKVWRVLLAPRTFRRQGALPRPVRSLTGRGGSGELCAMCDRPRAPAEGAMPKS
jgi:hypothetical protein